LSGKAHTRPLQQPFTSETYHLIYRNWITPSHTRGICCTQRFRQTTPHLSYNFVTFYDTEHFRHVRLSCCITCVAPCLYIRTLLRFLLSFRYPAIIRLRRSSRRFAQLAFYITYTIHLLIAEIIIRRKFTYYTVFTMRECGNVEA
jgi:hypothetical protein